MGSSVATKWQNGPANSLLEDWQYASEFLMSVRLDPGSGNVSQGSGYRSKYTGLASAWSKKEKWGAVHKSLKMQSLNWSCNLYLLSHNNKTCQDMPLSGKVQAQRCAVCSHLFRITAERLFTEVWAVVYLWIMTSRWLFFIHFPELLDF